jgi:SpoVK/Ycf46/Vps4 family AAA+-type ATPase
VPFRMQRKCEDANEHDKFKRVRDIIVKESRAVEKYAAQLDSVSEFGVSSTAARLSPGAQRPVPVEQNYVVPRPARSPQIPKEDPAKWQPPSNVPPASRAPPRRPAPPARARKPPSKDWKAPAAKVDSGRAGPAGRQKEECKEKDPWEDWEGQDKELAGNLANDIMEYSPGVRWNDIAGLHDAKQILKVCFTRNTCAECFNAPRNICTAPTLDGTRTIQ